MTSCYYICYNTRMNNKSIKNLIALGALALFVISSHTALAYVPGVWDPTPHVQTNEPGFTKVASTYDAPTTTQTQVVYKPVYITQPAQPAKKTVTTTQNTTVTRANTNTNFNNNGFVNDANYQNQNGFNATGMYPASTGNNLTALSLQGSGSFMPSSIWQWIIVIFLILAIIIIARMLTSKPAHHDVHTVAGH